MSNNIKKFNDFVNSDFNRKLIEKSKTTNRLVEYDNILDFFELTRAKGKNRGKYWLFLSLNVGGLSLEELGYKDKWNKRKKAIEQFRVLINEEQMNKLLKEIPSKKEDKLE